jgi:hypothetical protein
MTTELATRIAEALELIAERLDEVCSHLAVIAEATLDQSLDAEERKS